MSLIKNKEGNFYPVSIPDTDWHCDWLFSTHRGCPFDCVYCSSKRLNVRFGGDPCEIKRLKGEWIKDSEIEVIRFRDFPHDSIFVNPYCDIFALPVDDIKQILEVCQWNIHTDYLGNQTCNFIFQTKDPAKYFDYLDWIPEGSWLGTTIETDDSVLYGKLGISKAPNIPNRLHNMVKLKEENENFKYFVTIEPIMKFSPRLLFWINELSPDLVFVGANTSKIQLPEPTPDELVALIKELRKITVVYLKSNLKRLLPLPLHGWFQEIKKI
jgi:hypothetical protein